jgi:protein tyrosine/serine phosphatase
VDHVPGAIALEGARNLRDLGGLPCEDGSVTRSDRLFRSDSLSELTEADREVVARLGWHTVIDLRSVGEIDADRYDTTGTDTTVISIPLLDSLTPFEDHIADPALLSAHYDEIARDHADRVIGILRLLAGTTALPAVVHCALGKDRTGVVIALTLRLVGVLETAVLADYARSQPAALAHQAEAAKRHPEQADLIRAATALFGADPSRMHRFLAGIEHDFGSVEGWATAYGLADADIAALRRNLVAEPVGGR